MVQFYYCIRDQSNATYRTAYSLVGVRIGTLVTKTLLGCTKGIHAACIFKEEDKPSDLPGEVADM